MPAPSTPNVSDFGSWHVFGAPRQFHRFTLIDEGRANQVERHAVAEELREVLRLELKRLVERHHHAFEDTVEDGDRSRVIVLGLRADSGGLEGHHIGDRGVQQSAAAAIALLVPCANGIRRFQYPLARGFYESVGRHDGIDHPELESVGRSDRFALEQYGQRFVDADHSRQPLRAARAGQQADGHFRKTHDGLGIIDDDSIMTGKRQFIAAPQRQAVDGRYERLAAGLQASMHGDRRPLTEFERLMQRDRAAGARNDVFQIRARHECGFGRGDDCAFDAGIGGNSLDGLDQFLNPLGRDDIHRLGRIVESDERDPIAVDVHS